MGQRSGQVGAVASLGDRAIVRESELTDLPGDDQTAEIRAEIEHTRAEMSETIDEISERLSPTHIKEQVVEQVREATIGRAEDMVRNAGETVNEARYTFMETIRHNPIPAALAGIGLGWLWMNRRSGAHRYMHSDYHPERGRYVEQRQYYSRGDYGNRQAYGAGYYGGGQPGTMDRVQQRASDMVDQAGYMAGQARDTASSALDQAQQTAGEFAGQVQQTAGEFAGQVQQTAGQLVDQAQYQASRLEDRFQQQLRENPLAVGAVALALGAALGMAVPETRMENEWMGEARDNLFERAQEMASETVDKVQQVASEVSQGATETIKEQAREQGLTSG